MTNTDLELSFLALTCSKDDTIEDEDCVVILRNI